MLYVLAYPKFQPRDLAAVEQFRSAFEPQRARMVRAHVTLVFGVTSIDEVSLAEVTLFAARAVKCFNICFSKRQTVFDPLDRLHRVFLLPSVGHDVVASIYQMLHRGVLSSQKRFETGFEPHMTIATTDDVARAEAATTKAEEIKLPIWGTIDELTVVKRNGDHLKVVSRASLAG